VQHRPNKPGTVHDAPTASETLPSRNQISSPDARSVATAANGSGNSEN
jgi:hypothetical protein